MKQHTLPRQQHNGGTEPMTTQPNAQGAARTTFPAGFGVRCLKANPLPSVYQRDRSPTNSQEIHMPGDG